MTRHSYLNALVAGLICVAPLLSRGATAPRLRTPVVAGNTVQLWLEGDTGTRYRIEASTNVALWTEVASGIAQSGLFRAEHTPSPPLRWVYYRGVQVGDGGGTGNPFPTVTSLADTNTTAGAVVLPDRPSELRVEGPKGIVYTLNLPTNAVAEPTLVTLTALSQITGLPSQAGPLTAVRLEPGGLVLRSPAFLQVDFPSAIDGRRVSSFAFDNDGRRLHLVPDVVTENGTTHRVRLLVNQLRSHGCGIFTLPELDALAGTVPPPRASVARRSLHASLEECYPDEESAAKEMKEEIEDRIRPRQQEAAAILGRERQNQLLGVTDEAAGNAALLRVIKMSQDFYRAEIESRVSEAKQSCAKAQALTPWALGIERQEQLLGGGDGAGTLSASTDIICGAAKRCQEQALECCRSKGGDTRLVQTLLGIERQRQLLGAGPECGELSMETLEKECAPEWYGTLTIRISGQYLNRSTNGITRIRRSMTHDSVITAQVLSVRVRHNTESIFAPAYTSLDFVMGGDVVASERREKVDTLGDTFCDGKPSEMRRDTWESAASGPLEPFTLKCVIMAPGSGNVFLSPYLNLSTSGVERDMRWQWTREKTYPSEFTDEDCVTETQSGGDYDPKAGFFGASVFAKEGEFTWTDDSIRFSYHKPEPMRFDFQHLFNGVKDIEIELHRTR